MKACSQEDFKKFALEILEKTYKENPRKIVVTWVSSSATYNEIGRISSIEICEREIRNERDLSKWQERIILRNTRAKYYESKTKSFVNFDKVLREIKKCYNSLSVSICVKIIKKLREKEYFVKLFDKYFKLKTDYNLVCDIYGHKYEWLSFDISNFKLFELNKDEVIAELL